MPNRAVTIVAAAGLTMAVLGETAEGQQSCQALQAELARLESGFSPAQADRAARYDRALREQAQVFAQTREEARSAGCLGGGFLFFRSRPQPVCRTLVPRLQEMEANMARLQRQRDQHARGGDLRRIEEIRWALQRGRCYDDRRGFPGFFARGPWGAQPQEELRARGDLYRRGGDLYRTVCVRKCDGYFFPVSFSTTAQNFPLDRQICQAMCPAAEAELYYHPDPASDPPDMFSLSGQAYSQLPNAYRHRKEHDPSCTCGSPQAPPMSVAALSMPERVPAQPAEPAAAAPHTPRAPIPRPEPGEDPETLAMRAAGFDLGALRGTARADGTGAGRSVRVVGPSYWGTPQHDDVLLMPVPN